MHPNALLDLTTELLRSVLKFDAAADGLVSMFFRKHRDLGARERHTLAETTYTVLRQRLLYQHLAQAAKGAEGPVERRLAILAWQGNEGFLRGALNPHELIWLTEVAKIDRSLLPDKLRHNLPDWLANPLRDTLGDEFWPLVDELARAAPLDLRVNSVKAKRDDVQRALLEAGIESTLTPYSPWGLRIQGKPALNKLALFLDGHVEVQDEGSQLLALLTDAKRGEMVVDFCAGAGGKTLALGASMRNTGRLYAFDTSGHRLEALKPRLARSGLSNVHPAQIVSWKSQLQEGAAGVFGSGAAAAETAPVVDLKLLHAKIGELTLEKDFLSGALSKAGLLSARDDRPLQYPAADAAGLTAAVEPEQRVLPAPAGAAGAVGDHAPD